MSEMLLEEGGLGQRARTCAEHILTSGRDLMRFIEKTFLLSDLRNGRAIHREPESAVAELEADVV